MNLNIFDILQSKMNILHIHFHSKYEKMYTIGKNFMYTSSNQEIKLNMLSKFHPYY